MISNEGSFKTLYLLSPPNVDGVVEDRRKTGPVRNERVNTINE